ncbi:MAG: hypothetical protein M3540_01560, partial [Actinomycetota bacterium]|nr:hypothetical protein [Actinomycetota bacterium]
MQVLTLPGRRPVYVGSRRGGSCAADGGRPLGAIALSGDGRVLWQVASEGNTVVEIGLFTAAVHVPGTHAVTPTYFAKDEGNPDYVNPIPLPTGSDGKAILFYARCDTSEICTGNRRQPGIYRLAGRRSSRLANVTGPVGLAVSGRRFAFVTNSLRCCNSTPAWSHDGTRLAWIYHGNLSTVRADGTDERQLAAAVLPPRRFPDAAQRPSWSPDDARLAFESTRGEGGVYRVDATGSGLRRLASGTAPAWSPDGTRIAFVRGTGVYSIAPDGSSERRLTTAERPTAGPLSWSPDSTRIAVSRGGDIYSLRADGAGETRLTTSPRTEAHPAWSPDGARIAYVDGSAIAVVNADGTGATRLTSASDRSPAWSRDSKRIAFIREEIAGQGALWIMNADGSGQSLLIPAERYPDSPQWSPGGGTIVVGDWYDPEGGNLPRDPGVRLVSSVDGNTRKIAPVRRSPVEI